MAKIRSSRCLHDACIEVEHHPDGTVTVSSNQQPGGPTLTYTQHDWKIELAYIHRHGLPYDVDASLALDYYVWRYMGTGTPLVVTRDEMDAFVAGVQAGEFRQPAAV